MNFNQQDLIDSYLRGELSGKDLAAFEHQMDLDISFKDEVQFEQFVKDGISQYRKSQLKSRLDALDVTSDVIAVGIGANALVKTIGGSMVAVLLGVVSFYAWDSSWSSEEPVALNYVNGQYYPIPLDIPEVHIPENLTLLEEIEKSSDEISQIEVVIREERVQETSLVDELGGVELGDDNTSEFVPTVTPPDLNDVGTEEAINTETGSIPDFTNAGEVESSQPLDVQTIDRKFETIRYRYIDGKLYLYGDFKSQPYEIIEINKLEGKNIYVFFDRNYYEVGVTDEVEDLPLIKNQTLIKELEILRNNKIAE